MAKIESRNPIEDFYVDQVIKANEAEVPNSPTTQGAPLRQLIKDLRDRLETELINTNEDIAGKVEKVAGKGLSTLDFTQADKDTIDNFNNWSDEVASTDYVDAKLTEAVTMINNDVGTKTKGIVKLLDAPFGNLRNTDSTDMRKALVILEEGENVIYNVLIPANTFAANKKGFLKAEGILILESQDSGEKYLYLDLIDKNGNLKFSIPIVMEEIAGGLEKRGKFEVFVHVTGDDIDATSVFVGHPIFFGGIASTVNETYQFDQDYAIGFSTSNARLQARVTIHGLKIELASFN